MASTTFTDWFAAYQKQHPDAKIDATTRNLFWYWRYKQGDPVGSSLRDPSFQTYMAGRGITITPPSSGDGGGGGDATAGTPTSTPDPKATGPTVSKMDAAAESRINYLYQTLFGLPALYNAQRSRSAINTQGTLLDQGYYDTVGIDKSEAPSDAKNVAWDWKPSTQIDPATEKPVANNGGFPVQVREAALTDYAAGEKKPEGNITYKLKLGPDGRLYRQAYMKVADTMAARGVYSSSLISDTNRQNQQNLDAARDSITRGYDNQVFQLGQQQGEQTRDINQQIQEGRLNYAQYQADNPAMIPGVTTGPITLGGNSGVASTPAPGTVTPATTTSPATTTPATAAPTAAPSKTLGSWSTAAAGQNATQRLRSAVRKRNPGVSFKIVRQGNRYVAVRTR